MRYIENIRKRLLLLSLILSVSFYAVVEWRDAQHKRAILEMYSDIYDILTEHKSSAKELLQNVKLDPICKELSNKYLDLYYERMYFTIKNGSMRDILENIEKPHADEIGRNISSFNCDYGSIVWLSHRKRMTIAQVEGRIVRWINEHQKVTTDAN